MGTNIDYEYAVNLEVHPKNELNIDIMVASPCGMIDADAYAHISQTSFTCDAFHSTSVHFEMDEDQARMHSFLTRRRAGQANSTIFTEEIILRKIDSEYHSVKIYYLQNLMSNITSSNGFIIA